MKLGENILKLRKKQCLSQEQLGEKIFVTRQTISNWELGETSPNPEQLKMLSKALNVSIDELLDNDLKNVLEEKVSNTEKLAGIIIKILKVIGILIIIFLVIDVVAFFLFTFIKEDTILQEKVETIELLCSQNNIDYTITIRNDGKFYCSNCPKNLQIELKNNYVDFNDIYKTEKNITDYFKNNNGTCD